MFEGPFDHSIIKRAKERKSVEIEFIKIRQFGIGKHKLVDDTPYGGGAGMILRVDVLVNAIESAKCTGSSCKEKVILLDAAGKTFTQKVANEYSSLDHIILICGHYEGVDHRIYSFIDDSISIGDYVLTGGEIAAIVVTDAVSRLLPGVLGKEASWQNDSFQATSKENQPLLEHPQYTRPETFRQLSVPEILLSGNHKKISQWRKEESQERTREKRPDILPSLRSKNQ